MMWRRVADSVSAIEGYQNPMSKGGPGSYSPTNSPQNKKRMNGAVFGNQLVPSFIQQPLRTEAMNQANAVNPAQTNGATSAQVFNFNGVSGLSSPRQPATMIYPQQQLQQPQVSLRLPVQQIRPGEPIQVQRQPQSQQQQQQQPTTPRATNPRPQPSQSDGKQTSGTNRVTYSS